MTLKATDRYSTIGKLMADLYPEGTVTPEQAALSYAASSEKPVVIPAAEREEAPKEDVAPEAEKFPAEESYRTLERPGTAESYRKTDENHILHLNAGALALLVVVLAVTFFVFRPNDSPSRVSPAETGEWEDAEEETETEAMETEAMETEADAFLSVVYTITGVNVREQPNIESAIVGTLGAGTPAVKLGEDGNWTIIEFNGQKGYVNLTFL